jgi:general L-amino acid transport system substrate-binding protein
MKRKLMGWAFAATTSLIAATAATAGTLDDVKAKGFIQCGVSQGLIGFSNPDAQNNWTGMDVDFCRAVAAAVFNDPQKVKFTPLTAKDRFTALQSGEIDILSRNTTWTMSRDTSLGLKFAGVMYYDGQGFLVKSSLGVDSALKLSGAAVCTQTGTTTELNLADYFKANKMDYKVVAFEKNEEVLAAYQDGRCDVFTTDQSGLYAD